MGFWSWNEQIWISMQRFSKWHKLLGSILKEGGEPLFLFLETFLQSFGIKLQAMSNQAMSSYQNQLSQQEIIRVVCVCEVEWLGQSFCFLISTVCWSDRHTVEIRIQHDCHTAEVKMQNEQDALMQSRSRHRMLTWKQRWSSWLRATEKRIISGKRTSRGKEQASRMIQFSEKIDNDNMVGGFKIFVFVCVRGRVHVYGGGC